MTKKYNKYIIVFLLPEWYQKKVEKIMDTMSQQTRQKPLYEKMIPHISIHRPIKGLNFEKVKNLAQSIVLRTHKSRIRVGGIDHFGKKYIIAPVLATKKVAEIWTGIHELFSQVPEYEHGPFDYDNTLHITYAEDMVDIFDTHWPYIKKNL